MVLFHYSLLPLTQTFLTNCACECVCRYMCDDQELSLRQMGELPQVTYVFSPTESRASSGSGCHGEVTLQQQTVGCKFNSQSTEICMHLEQANLTQRQQGVRRLYSCSKVHINP